MPRLLLLTTTSSYRAGAFLDAARRLGADVVVGTDRPQATSVLHPAGHLALDFLDPESAVAAIRSHASRWPISAVVAAEDEGAVLAARAAAALGIVHAAVPAVEACRDKLAMRRALRSAGRRTPWFQAFAPGEDPREVAARVSYPCVVKPTFLSASRGVIRADDAASLAVAFQRVASILSEPDVVARSAGRAPEILIEEYLPGVEVALEGLLTGGRLRSLAIFDKPDPLVGPFFEETIYTTPSRLRPELQEAVEAETRRVVEDLGLREGPVHAELRIHRDSPCLVEIAPRSIGGLCSRALRFGDGVSLEELILRQALGMDTATLERERAASGVMMIPIPRAGVLRSIEGLDGARAVPDVDEVRITVAAGTELVPLPEGGRYLGFIFARAASPDEVEQALRRAHRRLSFDIVPLAAAADRNG